MDTIVERCCGLDVHQAVIVASVLIGEPGKRVQKQTRSFRALTAGLSELQQWLREQGVTHVAMEATGIYWVPVYAHLEGQFELIVGNATHIKSVPGRKTDVKDSEWIADLARHGLIRKSFVPPKDLRELRDLVRYRMKLVQSRTAERNRLLRMLETANVKLSSVMTDVFGASGRAMLAAIVSDSYVPADVAQLARGLLRKKTDDLALALHGRVEKHQRFILRMQLTRLDQVEADLKEIDAEIDARLVPYRAQFDRLIEIPGVDRVTAATIIAELGIDMHVFPSHRHAAAWAGVCPGNHESAGRKKRAPARKGNVHLVTALVQAALCASRAKGTYLRSKYWKLVPRLGKKRAAMAVAHKILVAVYHMLAADVAYADLGEAYLDKRNAAASSKGLVKRLEGMGYKVTLEKAA
ncbi:MAG: IS110 family transposase [Proteobacteria bacterium]|jgi:transposase|nr:IS110 family transposase [Pseudomonadota bacterium]